MSEQPTLKMLAEKLGLSKGAVSLALRGRPGVSDATRQKVRALAKELGWRPNPLLSSLAEARWRDRDREHSVNLALLAEADSDSALAAGPEFKMFESFAAARGYGLSPLALTPKRSPKEINRILHTLAVHGVFFQRLGNVDIARNFDWKALNWDAFSWIAVEDGLYSRPPIHQVLHNALVTTQRVLQTMLDRGVHRLVFIRSPDQLSRTNVRQHGAFLLMKESYPGAKLLEIPLLDGRHIAPKQIERIRAHRPDALLLGFRALHLQLPPDLQKLPWASLGLSEEQSGIAGGCISRHEITESAVDLLDFQIRRREHGIPDRQHSLMVDGNWVEGQSFPIQPPSDSVTSHA